MQPARISSPSPSAVDDAPRRPTFAAIAIALVSCLFGSMAWAQGVSYLPSTASIALGLDALEAGAPTGSQNITATLEPLDASFSEGLLTVYLVAVAASESGQISAVFDRFDQEATIEIFPLSLSATGEGCRRVRQVVSMPEDYRELAVVFEGAGGWGAAPAVEGGEAPDIDCPALHRGAETSP
ncbi:MAG: hypothetical protein K8J08_03020, partial [Thermoanaerobaculia bacterium]|nr:hypothetical protein [Thermoanaerobaculia bacterium]